MLERESIRSGVSFLLLIAGAAASLATSYADPEIDADGAVSGRVGGAAPIRVWRLDIGLNEEATGGDFDGGKVDIRSTGSGGGQWGGIGLWVLTDPAIEEPSPGVSPTAFTDLRLECPAHEPCRRTLYVVIERRPPGTGEVGADVTAHGVVTYRNGDDPPSDAAMDLGFTEISDVPAVSSRLAPRVVRAPMGKFQPLAVYDATVTVETPPGTGSSYVGYLAAVTRGRANGSIDVFQDDAFGSDSFLQGGGLDYLTFDGGDCVLSSCPFRFRVEIDTDRRMRWWPEALVLFPDGDVSSTGDVTIELRRVRL